jgi:hypothetical protein
MSKTNILTWMVVSLFILNILLIGLILFKPVRRDKREEPKFYIIKTLDFDAAQEKAYEKLIDWHRAQMQTSNQKMMTLKNKLYVTLNDNATTESIKDSLVRAINAEQLIIEQTNYKHFLDIKKLCKPDQLSKFNQLTQELSKLFSPQHPPKHGKK